MYCSVYCQAEGMLLVQYAGPGHDHGQCYNKSLDEGQSQIIQNCQAWVQVQGLSQISKRPGPGACSYNCNVSTTTHHP